MLTFESRILHLQIAILTVLVGMVGCFTDVPNWTGTDAPYQSGEAALPGLDLPTQDVRPAAIDVAIDVPVGAPIDGSSDVPLTATGGASGFDGASETVAAGGGGGATGAGGIIGSGGSIGTGGVVGTGGSIGTGGVVGAGGSVGTGGVVGAGGSTSTGGSTTCGAQTDCGTTSYCKIASGTAGSCVPKNPNGTTATQTFECTSNIVADGVCCDIACTGCNACSGAPLTAGAAGKCLFVVAGQVAHSACTASSAPCGLDGKCDGAGSCRPKLKTGDACSDPGTPCITGSTCQAGACAGGAQILCNNPPACKQSTTCSGGSCNYTQNVPDGTPDTKCAAATPVCYSGGCVECTSDTTCPTNRPSCDVASHTCGCRKPSAGNLLTNPGFDGSMNGWTNLGTVSLAVDADGCAASNSIYIGAGGDQRDPRQCISLAPGTPYYFGGKFKGGTTGTSNNVTIDFYDGAGCSGNYLGAWNYFISQTADWTQNAVTTFTTPTGTASALVGVIASYEYLDQLYVSSANQF